MDEGRTPQQTLIYDAVYQYVINRVGPAIHAMAAAPYIINLTIEIPACLIEVARDANDADMLLWYVIDPTGIPVAQSDSETPPADAITQIASAIAEAALSHE